MAPVNWDKRLVGQAAGVRRDLAWTVGLGLLTGVVLVVQARVLSQVVGGVFLGRQSLDGVAPLLFFWILLSLARAGSTWGSEVAAQRAAGRIKSDLRERLAAHMLALGPAYTRGERSGELVNTAVEGVEALDAYFSQYLPQLALAVLVPLTMLAFILSLDLVSGLVLLLTAPLVPLFMILIGNLADTLTRRQWRSLGRLSSHFLDVLQGLTTLKLLGRSRDQIRTIAQVSDRFRQTTLGVLRVAFLSALVMELVTTLSIAVVAVEIGLRLLYGRLSFEQAFFVLILAPDFYLPLRLLGTRFHAGLAGTAAARRIFEILDAPGFSPVSASSLGGKIQRQTNSKNLEVGSKVPSSPQPSPSEGEGADSPFPLREGGKGVRLAAGPVRFEDVYYAYDSGQRPALNGLSFQIEPGHKVALVGPSGAGKSTAVQLLLRFVEPDRGAITVAGTSLRDWPAPAWRAQVAWVPQRPYLFHASVAENIRLARPDAGLDAVIQAAEKAQADTFIRALPQGYGTLIGERGARLSGGQAQRIALARAFLKDAPLLILDEATSNLDPEIEAALQEAVGRLLSSRTALIVTHRLNTAYQADQIVVVTDGRAVETGTHATLMQQDSLYRRLVTAHATRNTGTAAPSAYGEAG
jgi:thiol reductant ABC exporter CydD subunit